MSVKIYVEGGGDRRELHSRCRKGFRSFFCKAGLAGRMPKIIACGGRKNAYDKFVSELSLNNEGMFIVLLVDSEAPVMEGSGPWLHLRNRDKWKQPDHAADENAHLMVQCMEAWFLADKNSLKAFFGRDFDIRALPGNLNTEEVAKADVLIGLKNATRQCQTKGEYGKGRHSFDLLSRLDPEKVIAASLHAKRLVDILKMKAS